MKKRLLSLLSLIMAFVLCFALVACSDNKKPSNGKKPSGNDGEKKSITVPLDDLLDAINDVFAADGFTGSASYSTSTKNTEKVSKSVAIDKRGSKLKAGDAIVDLDTGYVYFSGEDGYVYEQHPFGGIYERALGFIAGSATNENVNAIYDKTAKTVTFKHDISQDINKYMTPLYSAYKNNKTLNALFNDYCNLLFGKSFDDIYSDLSDFIKDENSTVGMLTDIIEAMGVDVFELLGDYGMPFDEDMVAMIKARKLSEMFVGGYNYVINTVMGMLPGMGISTVDEYDDDDDFEDGGMSDLLMGAMQAMFFDEVDTSDIDAKLMGIKALFVFGTKTLTDMMLEGNAEAADLYNAIKQAVVFKELSVTVTLTVDDDKTITGIKFDCLASHTYTGSASEGSLLADNDYAASVELKIDEYTTSPADFVITFDPEFDYRRDVTVYVYELSDTDFHVYYETAGNNMMCEAIVLYDDYFELIGNVESMGNAYSNAVSFSDSDSSFVFNSAFLKSYFDGASVGTELNVVVYYDVIDYFTVTLVYMDGEPAEVLDYVFGEIGGLLGGMIGGDSGYEEYPSEY